MLHRHQQVTGCKFKFRPKAGVVLEIEIQARLGDDLSSPGILDNDSRDSNFVQIQSALETFDNLFSIAILSDWRGDLVGVHAAKNTHDEDDKICTLSPENLPLTFVDTKLRKMDPGSVSGLVSLAPLQISDSFGSKVCLGVVAGPEKERTHRTWVIMRFTRAMRMDSQKLGHLKSIASAVGATASNLFGKICCLDPECNPFGLNLNDQKNFAHKQASGKISAKSEYGLTEVFQKLDEFERLIVELMAEGKSNGEIAKLLYVSTSSVRNASSKIYNKIGARNRQDAVVLYTKHLYLIST